MKPSVNPTTAAMRRYYIELVCAGALYIVVLFVSIFIAKHGVTGALGVVVLLTPVVPVALVFAAGIRCFRGIDELGKRVIVEGLAIAGCITAFLAVTYGFLESAGLPNPSAWFTWSVFMASWIVVNPIVAMRYRA